MANGILDINISEDQQVKDANLGLTGEQDMSKDKEEVGQNLFLSPQEQRGLEAATFATMIGQAPSTGSLMGDFFSTIAQTGPASLATFKERQSIKEKEAEYKSKQASLAGKLDFDSYFDTSGGGLTPVILTKEEAFANRDRLIKSFNSGANPTEVIDNRYGSPTFGQPIKEYGNQHILQRNLSIKNHNEKLGDVPTEQQANKGEPAFLPAKKYKVLYDYNEDVNVSDIRTEKTDEEIEQFKKEKGEAYSKNLKVQSLDTPEDARYTILIKDIKDSSEAGRTAQQDVKKRLTSAKSLLHYQNEIITAIATQDAPTGASGSAVQAISDSFGFVRQGFEQAGLAFFGSKRGVAEAEAELNNGFEGGDPADKQVLDYLKDQKEKGNLSGNRKIVYDFMTGNSSGLGAQAGQAQKIKTAVTQLAYMIAKTRESGGKFSVPDIEFAFRSIGNGSDPNQLLVGMKTIIDQAVSEVVTSSLLAYSNKLRQEETSLYDLWNDTDLRAVRNVFEHEAERKFQIMPTEEQDRWLNAIPKDSTLYNKFKDQKKEEEKGPGNDEDILL